MAGTMPLAVQGMTLVADPPAALSNSVVQTPPSTKGTAENKPLYCGSVDVLVPPGGIAHPAFTNSGTNTVPATFTIAPAGVTKVLLENNPCLTVGDMATATVTGMQTVGTGSAPISVPVTIKIADAGQTKVLGS